MQPSGEQVEIRHAGYRAVVTEAGAGLRVLEHDRIPLVDGYPADEMATGGRGQLLMPWPNRVDGGRYSFDGRDLQLALSEPEAGNAIHGLARWLSWTVAEQAEDRVRLTCRLMAQKGYPWTLELSADYALSPDGLTVTQAATNLGDSPAPYAQGAHPYLSVGRPVDECDLTLPTPPDQLAPASPFGSRRLDDSFTDLARDADGTARCLLRDPDSGRAVELWLDERHRWLHVYTADKLPAGQARRGVALEPMTAPAGAFASGRDLERLDPGARFAASWGIRAAG